MAITATTTRPSAAACKSTGTSIVPPTVNPPTMEGRVARGSETMAWPAPCVVNAVSTTRRAAKTSPTASSTGKAPARAVFRV